jgi:hypothetical protein
MFYKPHGVFTLVTKDRGQGNFYTIEEPAGSKALYTPRL